MDYQVAGKVRKYKENQGKTRTTQGALSVARMEQGAQLSRMANDKDIGRNRKVAPFSY